MSPQGMMFSSSANYYSQPCFVVPNDAQGGRGSKMNNNMMYSSATGTGSIMGISTYTNSSAKGSRRARSLANSSTIIQPTKLSWASNSFRMQSTILAWQTQMSLMNINSISKPKHEQDIAWIIVFHIPNWCMMQSTEDAKQASREKVALFVIIVSCVVFLWASSVSCRCSCARRIHLCYCHVW